MMKTIRTPSLVAGTQGGAKNRGKKGKKKTQKSVSRPPGKHTCKVAGKTFDRACQVKEWRGTTNKGGGGLGATTLDCGTRKMDTVAEATSRMPHKLECSAENKLEGKK